RAPARQGPPRARPDPPPHPPARATGPSRRLVAGGGRPPPAERHGTGRGPFSPAAAEAMRRILVENARRKRRERHGGGRARRDVTEVDLPAPEPREDLLALDEALGLLAAQEPQAAALGTLRYFPGLTLP